ncbi:tetratricopeptide repeat protein [Cesiribacter andamanensis]|uniref:Putative O-linked N-acetylglucosamine transferase, SPINDLY family n=1 Tax=Cesiribacter andamanensis AMV16 TaxID=1279009 RepID=M7NN80_9BACT|nr:tetratricopeptide repeat protein [Cesiribacter andamanensis]EMR03190.1 putative O-linked N-acetylglucosamine transferase, SPINDLY family [Cesiribacter andamanensis AMV16]
MTQMRNLLSAVTLLSVFLLSGCSLNQMVKKAKDQQLTVEPNPLELHGDSVRFTMSATLPAKTLKKGKEYIVKPYYVYNGKEIELQNLVFRAEDYPNADTEQPRISRTLSFYYEEDMRRGELFVQGVARNPENNKTKETDRMKVAEGVVTTSRLAQEGYYPSYSAHGYNNQEELEPTMIGFFFEQGRSNLRPSETRSDRGTYMRNFIAEKNVTRTVSITGTHSPEGTERINTNLSRDRAAAIESFYRQNMKRYDYKGMADSINFILKPVVLDWAPFSAALQEYQGIDASAKQQMQDIINGSGTFEEKEDRLQQVPGYRRVFNDIYPLLRTAKAEILTVKEKKTDAEIATLARQIADGTVSADTLSNEELAYAASLTPNLQERERIYAAAGKKSNSYQAQNNLGTVYLEQARQATNESQRTQLLERAATQFEQSNRTQQNAEAQANLAVVYLMQGNRQRAYEAIQAAERLNPSELNRPGLQGVKGYLEMRNGRYDDAIRTLSQAEETAENLYNLGLAYLLKRDYQNALTRFNEATQKNNRLARAYYGASIANSRLGNESAAFTALEQAVKLDPELKRSALEDLEFSNYQENERFRNTLR